MISYRPEIDGLRAIAIASVVLFHSGAAAFSGGYTGVDIFFVISGYLITSIILKARTGGGFSYLDFYARRARRILPALLAMTLTVTALCLVILLPADLVEYGKILIYTILFGANFRLTGTPAYFDTASQENPLLHMWSLSVEEQFYLLWPTLLVAMLAFLSPRRARLAVVLLALASLLCAAILVQNWPKSAFYHLPSRGWELLIGAMLAMGLAPQIKAKATAEALSLLGLVLMLVPVFLYDKETAFPGLAALPPVLGCAFVIHAEGAFRTRVGALLSLRPVVFLGLISYSLYLWHWPVFALPSYVLMRETTAAETAMLIALAVLLATLSWRFVERPFRKAPAPMPRAFAWRNALAAPPLTRAGYGALALTAALIASGSYFQESKGAAWRFSMLTARVADMPGSGKKIEGCSSESTPIPGLSECDIGTKPGEKVDVVIWGDSHATKYVAALAKVFGRARGFMMLDCLPLIGADSVTAAGHPVRAYCEPGKAYAMNAIQKLKPKIVIMASRWALSEDLPYGHEARVARFLVEPGDATRTREHSREMFAKHLSETVETLKDLGSSVLLMGQVPEMKVSVPRCVLLNRYLGLADDKCLLISRDEVETRQRNVNRVLRDIAAANEKTAVFWPLPQMCDAEQCYAIRDGRLLYADGDHLSLYGALSLVDAIKMSLPKEFLDGAIPARSVSADAPSQVASP
jgi:peptidoglycan/LPS O-acetylase OafA/YrhL